MTILHLAPLLIGTPFAIVKIHRAAVALREWHKPRTHVWYDSPDGPVKLS